MTSNLSTVKSRLALLYSSDPKVHIDLFQKRDRKHITNAEAEITAVYPNVFTAKISEDGVQKNYTFQYVDLITHNVVIRELSI